MHPQKTQNNGHKYLALLKGANPQMVGKKVTVSAVMRELEKDIVFYDQSGGGVTFSGGEPLMQPLFLNALLASCRENDIHTAVDTSGYAGWDVFEMTMERVNLFLYDLKIMEDEMHTKYTGVSNRLILENINKLHETGAKIEIRIPLIPGYTDSAANLTAIADYLKPMKNIEKICLLPYNQIGEEKYQRFRMKNRSGRHSMQTPRELQEMQLLFTGLQAEARLEGSDE